MGAGVGPISRVTCPAWLHTADGQGPLQAANRWNEPQAAAGYAQILWNAWQECRFPGTGCRKSKASVVISIHTKYL